MTWTGRSWSALLCKLQDADYGRSPRRLCLDGRRVHLLSYLFSPPERARREVDRLQEELLAEGWVSV